MMQYMVSMLMSLYWQARALSMESKTKIAFSLGAYFSFGGVVCFKNAKSVWESVRACPADRLLTETDSPYLSPFRGEKNSPANIPVIADKIAELRGEERSFLVALIDKNAERLFPRVRI